MNPQYLRTLLDAATPGPVIWTQTLPMTIDEQCKYMAAHLSHGNDGPMNGVGCLTHPRTVLGADPSNPEHMVEMAMCGNGPNGENNARMLVAARNALPSLVRLWEAVEAYDIALDENDDDAIVRGLERIYDALSALRDAKGPK